MRPPEKKAPSAGELNASFFPFPQKKDSMGSYSSLSVPDGTGLKLTWAFLAGAKLAGRASETLPEKEMQTGTVFSLAARKAPVSAFI